MVESKDMFAHTPHPNHKAIGAASLDEKLNETFRFFSNRLPPLSKIRH